MQRFVTGAAVLTALGCGARSTLLLGSSSGAGGAGPAASSSASSGGPSSSSATGGGGSTSSSSGTGGFPACMTITGDRFRVPGTDGFSIRAPALVALDGDPHGVALVARADSFDDPGSASEVIVTRIEPWGAWPPSIPTPVHLAVTRSQSGFQTAPSPAPGGFALLVDGDASGALGDGLHVARDARPDGSATFAKLSSDHEDPGFVLVTPNLAFGAAVEDADGGAHTYLERLGPPSGPDACGLGPLVSAGWFDGVDVFAALSTQGSDSPCPTVPPTVTSSVEFRRLGHTPSDFDTHLFRFPLAGNGAGPVTRLVWVAQPNEAWLVAGEASLGGHNTGLQAALIGAGGTVVEPLRTLPIFVDSAFAAAPWRNADIFVFALYSPEIPRSLVAFVWHPMVAGGDEYGDYVILDAADPPGKELAAIARSSNHEWLVAWSEDSGAAPSALYVARVACLGAPAP